LGSDRSRGYSWEMICADFLAGVNLDNGDPDVLVRALTTSQPYGFWFYEVLATLERQGTKRLSDLMMNSRRRARYICA